jgi:phosphoribosylaminoimidazole-succinocarboxamide synthase
MNEKIYKGSSKTLYQSDEDYALIMSFDDTLKIPGQDSIEVAGKGVVNNSISSYIMQKLEMVGIDNHLISKTAHSTMKCNYKSSGHLFECLYRSLKVEYFSRSVIQQIFNSSNILV